MGSFEKFMKMVLCGFRRSIISAGLALIVACSNATAGTSQPEQAPHKRVSFLDRVESLGESILRPSDPFRLNPGRDPNGWSFTLAPYGWLPGLSGNVGIGDLPLTPIGYSAQKVLGSLDWAVFLRGEVRKDATKVQRRGQSCNEGVSHDLLTFLGLFLSLRSSPCAVASFLWSARWYDSRRISRPSSLFR